MSRNPYFNYIGTAFSEVLANALNAAASSSLQISELLDLIEGKTIHVELTDFNYDFVLSSFNHTVQIDNDSDGSADVVIRSTLPSLVRLATNGEADPTSLKDVEIIGNVRLIQQLHLALADLKVDWEGELSKRIGDIPARQAGNLFRWGASRASGLSRTIHDKVRGSLIEEHYLVPNQGRVESFLNDVDTLKADVDRLEKRVERLERAETQ